MARKTERKTNRTTKKQSPRGTADRRGARSRAVSRPGVLLSPKQAAALPPAVLITGAGAGIGRTLAFEMAARGRMVYAGVRNLERAERDYAGAPENLRVIRLDVNQANDAPAALARMHADGFRCGTLVNNAGYGLYGAFEELGDAAMRAQFETNFFAPQRLSRLVLPEMRAARDGCILNVSSILGQLALPLGSAYCSSKWALEGWSESLRFEVAPLGVRVSLAEPGLIRTNFKANMDLPTATAEDRNSERPYAALDGLLQREYGGFYSSAESAARSIAGVLERGRPPARFRVGLDARIYYWLRRLLPATFLDWMFRRVVARSFASGTAGH